MISIDKESIGYKICKKIFDLFLYFLKRLIDYKLRLLSVFNWGIKYITFSLLFELTELSTSNFTENIYSIIRSSLDSPWGLVCEWLLRIVLGDLVSGYSMISIFIKLYLITLFCIFEWKKANQKNWNWKLVFFWKWNWKFVITGDVNIGNINIGINSWKPTKKWFDEIKRSQYAPLINNKYIPELHEESEVEKQIIKLISKPPNNLTEIVRETEIFLNYCTLIGIEIMQLNSISHIEESLITLNKTSSIYSEITNISQIIDNYKITINQFKSLLESKNNYKQIVVFSLPEKLELSVGLHNLNKRINSNNFDLLIHKTHKNNKEIPEVTRRRNIFNATLSLVKAIDGINESIVELIKLKSDHCLSTYIIHGKAGYGKTHFSLNLVDKLNNKYVIFLKASSFSGNFVSIFHRFKEIVGLPDGLAQDAFLNKLNNFGIKGKTKIVFIIDGLNETTNHVNGFSSIWNEHFPAFIEELNNYSNIALIATCRTSYKGNIGNVNPNYLYEIDGFENESIRKKVVAKYFKHYNLYLEDFDNARLDFFEIPLVLSIFCKYNNPSREPKKSIKLGHNTYDDILEKFINTECIGIAHKLNRPSKTPVYNAINRSSIKFKENLSASLSYDDYLSSTDRKHIDDILTTSSVAYELLQGELIFMKDRISFDQEEVVVHTFQNIGGYLIAKLLLTQYPDPKVFICSNFYKLHLKTFGQENQIASTHQLALDIMKFMVTGYASKNDDLINYSKDSIILNLTWQFIFENAHSESIEILTKKLQPFLEEKVGWQGLLSQSLYRITDPNSSLNMNYISQKLKGNKSFFLDQVWTRFISDNTEVFIPFVDDFRVDTQIEISELTLNDETKLKLELCAWLLETTIQNIRDKTTHILLEYGTRFPLYILEMLEKFSQTDHLYIYERLAGIIYGICLRMQNDDLFINNDLEKIAQEVYNLQFSKSPKAPSYHYIVIDSFKHIIDLAIHKEVFVLNKEERESLNQYQFNHYESWQEITESDIEKVKPIISSWHNQAPDPLGKDFVTYTIPRLIKNDYSEKKFKKQEFATASIYKRIITNGYIPEEDFTPTDDKEQKFYYGESNRYDHGKIDRLGKKYSWNAFFEYAGLLLNKGDLDVWYEGDTSVTKHYNRLSDVELEVSFPKEKVSLDTPFIKDDLFKHRTDSSFWTNKEMFYVAKKAFKSTFDNKSFSLLYGNISQQLDKDYKVRSYLLIESFFVRKQDIVGKEESIIGKNYEWDNDIYSHGNNLSKVYFGELYWADNIPDYKYIRENIPTGEKEMRKVKLDVRDILLNEKYGNYNSGDIIEVEVDKTIDIDIIPSVVNYLWETDSNVYPTLSEFVPSPNIGKCLKLKSDPMNLRIIDEQGELAYKSETYNNDLIKQDLCFLRSDLLNKYLEENDLVLMYQVKQRTYDQITGDKTGDLRAMQFFFSHIEN